MCIQRVKCNARTVCCMHAYACEWAEVFYSRCLFLLIIIFINLSDGLVLEIGNWKCQYLEIGLAG